jgi:hypothetical protein
LPAYCDNTTGAPAAMQGSTGRAPPLITSQGMDAAVTAVPPGHRRRLTVTCDGAGASHGLSARPGELSARSNRNAWLEPHRLVALEAIGAALAKVDAARRKVLRPQEDDASPLKDVPAPPPNEEVEWTSRAGQYTGTRLGVPRAPYEVIGATRGETPPRSVTGRDVRASTPGGQPAGVVLTGPTSPRHRSPCLVGCLLQGG